MVTEVRKKLCKSCRLVKPVSQFKWGMGADIYCSQGCATKAEWLFAPVPRQRDA